MQYLCTYIKEAELKAIAEDVWKQLPEMVLRDVVTEQPPVLSTKAKACWSETHLYIRFWCQDNYILSKYEHRDDPLYEQDVVEVFIDPTATGEHYYEFELSPHNVIFDAAITIIDKDRAKAAKRGANELPYMTVDKNWDATNLQTQAFEVEPELYCYELRLPFTDLNAEVVAGQRWRWNLYRIDDDMKGVRHYSAWAPTGVVNFHVPSKFGELVFVKN
ncbi:carbohydrate-binding family 9-like protein [Paenibacillus yanchengensis]|uniref:Carbohydrate-binding family 9-like protein n=1 Tax=Paenibacillus yanchengensis TaxID=2035833 RepID=A0ABW4YG77_9BACL